MPLIASVLLSLMVLMGCSSAAEPQDTMVDRYTPVIQSVASPPRWFKGTDKRVHLVYELRLVNAFPVAVTVNAVEVLDATRGTSLAALRDAPLVAAMSLLAT